MSAKGYWQRVKDFFYNVNPFFLMTGLLAIMLVVPGQHSIWSQIKTSRQLKEKQEEYQYYKDEIKKSQKHLDEIKYKRDMLEKYARERYLMKEEDEDLYLLTDPDKK